MANEFHPTGDKEFDDTIAGLSADATFHEQIARALNDQFSHYTQPDNRLDLVQPEYSVSINDIATYLYDRFHELCEAQGLDVHTPGTTYEPFHRVGDTLTAELARMSELLVKGDVVWASNTYATSIVTPSNVAGEIHPVPVEDVVVGCFYKLIIMPLADDAHNLLRSLGYKGRPPVGIGLVLESAAYIDSLGDVHAEIFESGAVVIPLGSAGLDLRHLYLQQGN